MELVFSALEVAKNFVLRVVSIVLDRAALYRDCPRRLYH